MDTISNTASTSAILAIDLGKYKSVACRYDDATGEIRFTTLDTTRAELRRLIAKKQPAVVVIEACLLAGWVHDLCGELAVCCSDWILIMDSLGWAEACPRVNELKGKPWLNVVIGRMHLPPRLSGLELHPPQRDHDEVLHQTTRILLRRRSARQDDFRVRP
jgi:hypothetical protein